MKKRREWVKNAAIIFLSIMLVLTFFSNTIMNYSLPEVSAQYTSPGQVASRVRGSGTVEAAQPYNVSISEERLIEEVMVKNGDTVEKGQVLLKLAEGGTGSLEEVLDELDAANIEYQQKLLETIRNYDIPNTEIERLREDLADAREKAALAGNPKAQLTVAENKVEGFKSEIRLLQKQIDQLQRDIDSVDGEETELAAEEALVKAAADNLDIATANQEKADTSLERARRNLSEKQTELTEAKAGLEEDWDWDLIEKLEKSIKGLKSAVNSAQNSADAAADSVRYWTREKAKADKELEEAKAGGESGKAAKKKELQGQMNVLTDAKTESEYKLEKAQKNLDELKQNTNTEEQNQEQAKEAVKNAERALEDKIQALADTKAKDGQSDKISRMQLNVLQKKVGRLEKKAAKLQKAGKKNTVKAPVAGVISSISAVAGEKTTPDGVLAVIQIVEKGYQVKLRVTAEQSQKVKEGDQAELLNVWGGDVSAVISKIAAVEGEPKSRDLIFQVSGQAEVGQNLELSVGQQSAYYDIVVPNSAIHEDNNGKFILIVNAKPSPLGNRYIAQRVKVEVLAQDDTNAAVTGELQGGDFIITTSTKPLTDGMQVRLVEGGGL